MAGRITFISKGFKRILCSDGVKEAVTNAAQIIQSTANANNTRGGKGCECESKMGGYGGGRWMAFVSTTDYKSRVAEAEDKALSRAVM